MWRTVCNYFHLVRSVRPKTDLQVKSAVCTSCRKPVNSAAPVTFNTHPGARCFYGTHHSCSVFPIAGVCDVNTKPLPLMSGLAGWPSYRLYSKKPDTVEKRLIQLMDMWEVEDAVALLRQSVLEGVVPHPNVVLNLQQQIAHLGEVECLLDLYDFLKEHKLTTDTKFFQCLHQAYYNSGRISEGVLVLRLLYHRTREFADVDVYFTLLTVMVLRHFPDALHLIIQFVIDLKEAEEPVLEPGAALWKCYVLTENWSEADEVILNKDLLPLLPAQVTRIVHGVDKAEFDRVEVFKYLLDVPFFRQKLRVLVAESLVAELVAQKQWPYLLKMLKEIKTRDLPLHTDKLSSVLSDLKRHLSPQHDPDIDLLKQWCDGLRKDTT